MALTENTDVPGVLQAYIGPFFCLRKKMAGLWDFYLLSTNSEQITLAGGPPGGTFLKQSDSDSTVFSYKTYLISQRAHRLPAQEARQRPSSRPKGVPGAP